MTIGVVGDGFGALLVYSTAIYLGFQPDQIGIFGKNLLPDLDLPAIRLEPRADRAPLRIRVALPACGLADLLPARRVVAARTRARCSGPPIRKFNPGVPDIMAQASVVCQELGMPERVIGGTHVGWIVREPGPPPHFSLYDEEAQLLGRAKHLMVAPGHGPLAFPGIYGKARENPAMADRVVQSYEAKQYFQGGRYIVIGSGIASVNEWANCIESGAQCIALRRNPHPDEQDLNVPRCLFDGSGIDAFQGLVVRGPRPVPRPRAQGHGAEPPPVERDHHARAATTGSTRRSSARSPTSSPARPA